MYGKCDIPCVFFPNREVLVFEDYFGPLEKGGIEKKCILTGEFVQNDLTD
jgi:hypothetical protein